MDRILAASYGDKRQGELNRKPVDHHAAARIEAGYKARRASMGPREVGAGVMMITSTSCPLPV
jgi:hypothetical protein